MVWFLLACRPGPSPGCTAETAVDFDTDEPQDTQGPGWDGSGTTLQPNGQVQLNDPPQGFVLAALNTDTRNNQGEVILTRDGGPPQITAIPALTSQATVVTAPSGLGAVRATNTSQQAPIWLAAFGPGFGSPGELPADGVDYSLAVYGARETVAGDGTMRLVVTSTDGFARVLLVVGSQVRTVCVNQPVESPQPDCTEALSTPDNRMVVMEDWSGQALYVANLFSGSTLPTTSLLAL